MSNHIHKQTIPRAALLGAAVLIASTVALASNAKQSRSELASVTSEPAPLVALQVRFADRADGALLMIDAPTGRELAEMAPGSNNFVRGVLRGMFRVRKLESKGHDAPFILSREANGRRTLFDPETARRVDLDSFGPTNSAAFVALLAAGEAKRAEP